MLCHGHRPLKCQVHALATHNSKMTQTIGRVIRIGQKSKNYGMLCVPVYSNVGIATQRSLQKVVDIVFEKGEMLDSVVKR